MNGNASSAKSYRRGVRLGIYFKRVRDLLTKWDRRCVEAAKTHQVPAWLGHVPVYAAIAIGIGILAVTLFSLVSSFVLIIGIALFGLLVKHGHSSQIIDNENSGGWKVGEYRGDGHWYDCNGYVDLKNENDD